MIKRLTLQLYRFAVVAVVAWLVRDLAVRQRTQGDSPVVVDEVKSFFPEATTLRPDSSARDGLFILDRAGRELGYVVRTFPHAQDIIGYAGATDTLVVLDRDWKIVGLKIHGSEETEDYVKSVATDRRFLKKWNSQTWDAAADLDLKAAGIEGVSGATMTSMAIARGVKLRLQAARSELIERPALRIGWRDAGMVVVLVGAALMAFWAGGVETPLETCVANRARGATSVSVAGDLLAMKLFGGWARAGGAVGPPRPAWRCWPSPRSSCRGRRARHSTVTTSARTAPAQELLGRIRPRRWQLTLPAGAVRGLEYLPPAAARVLARDGVARAALRSGWPRALRRLRRALRRDRDVGGRGARARGVVVCAAGVLPAFGCPTGALLSFVPRARRDGSFFAARCGRRLGLLALAVVLHWQYLPLILRVKGVG